MARQIAEHLSYNFLQHARSLYKSPAVYITRGEKKRSREEIGLKSVSAPAWLDKDHAGSDA